ncbi:hypothetical protein [Methanobrevibacter sp.]|uniref:hypothetical protein n=1 Tax=Methanobrevibacter sp. TaxID=66852 RepID=UPI0025D88DB2|nr:hypothetical protein [Methanobrevibacter sp.]MBQ2666525.1 hypothetical protein [Methanobrevibacter sp.]
MFETGLGVVGTFLAFIVFSAIISTCCDDGSGSSTKSTSKTSTASKSTYNRNYSGPSFSECPSCGAPFFDGYCEECGFPDVNQGWLGENY